MPYVCTQSEREGMAAVADPSWNKTRSASAGLVSFLAADRYPRGDARAGGSGVLRLSLITLTARLASGHTDDDEPHQTNDPTLDVSLCGHRHPVGSDGSGVVPRTALGH